MGVGSSNPNQHIEQELGGDFPEGEIFMGFENISNNCYANSIIQAFFQCKDFRQCVLDYRKVDQDNIITHTQDLFQSILKLKKKTGITTTKKLLNFAKKRCPIFKGDYHQDCHEFFMWYVNEIDDVLNDQYKKNAQSPSINKSIAQTNWLQKIYQGMFVTRIECLKCNNKSERQEQYLNLSLDLEPNASITHCIKELSKEELMQGDDKFQCDNCHSLQDAKKRMLIKSLPKTMIIHFKRFKYDEKFNQMTKLTSKVLFPQEQKIKTNYFDDDQQNQFKYYDLSAIIIHIGQGIQFGHYVSVIKIQGKWYLFDDDKIDQYSESDIYRFYGKNFGTNNTACAYMLFYNEKKRD